MLNVEDVKAPATMSREELEAEVWYWRTAAGAALLGGLELLSEAAITGTPEMAQLMRRRLRTQFDTLVGALSGEEIDRCGLCTEVLVPGQPVLREVTEGEVHAACLGTHIDGDRYQLEPECVVDDNDDPDLTSDGVLTAWPRTPWLADEEIIRRLGAADELTEAVGARFGV